MIKLLLRPYFYHSSKIINMFNQATKSTYFEKNEKVF